MWDTLAEGDETGPEGSNHGSAHAVDLLGTLASLPGYRNAVPGPATNAASESAPPPLRRWLSLDGTVPFASRQLLGRVPSSGPSLQPSAEEETPPAQRSVSAEHPRDATTSAEPHAGMQPEERRESAAAGGGGRGRGWEEPLSPGVPRLHGDSGDSGACLVHVPAAAELPWDGCSG